ncbi:MAG TPA: lytic transglycosylase domain-containing protein, partial [Candidatus Polarisedimenticolaceae bacterium]|nr:lytic transglycosylase domain-containing protein [Candidatus Polarisedimenticolaceae bacterium]
ERIQKILVAAGKKFNVDPNFLASFYYAEQARTGDSTNNADTATPPPATGDGKWRDPAPPYGRGAPYATSSASANGPFQFIPSTWDAYKVDGNGDGDAEVTDLTDAAFGAAKYLAASGGKDGASEDQLRAAAHSYNHSEDYVNSIIKVYKYFSGASQTDVSGSADAGAVCGDAGGVSTGTADANGYVDPFRDIKNLQPMRIDQGVDYGGHGPIHPLGDAKIVFASDSNTGWPRTATDDNNGTFIIYKLKGGAAKDKYVYVSEHCDMKVAVGDDVTTDSTLCDLIEGSAWSESGWAPTPPRGSSAAAGGVYIEGHATAYGANFNNLLRKLGTPSGRYDNPEDKGHELGSLPAGWPAW